MAGAAGDIRATYARALKLQEAGRGEEAIALYTQVLMMRPRTAEAHFQLGRIHAAAGRLAKARASLSRAAELRPGEEAIWQALAQVVPPEERDAAIVEVAARLSADAAAGLGASLQGMGRARVAEPVLHRAADAGAETARRPLAQILLDTNRAEEAEEALGQPASGDAEGWHLMAAIRARLRRPGPARQAMGRAVAAGFDPVRGAIVLSDLLLRENETKAARRVIDSAIADRPDAGRLHGQRGMMAQALGDLEAARADLGRAIALDPLDAEAHRAYAAGGRMAADDPMLGRLEAALARPGLPDGARWRLHFARAKWLSDLGRDEDVFADLHAANALQRKAFPFDFDMAVTRARRHLAAFRAQLGGRPPEGDGAAGAIFVTGLPRSGTTLVEAILAAHSAVEPGGELPFMGSGMAPLFEALAQGLPPEPGELAEIGRRYLATARRRVGTGGLFTDKAIGTFTRVGFVAHALPGARILVLRRDPRDVALSAYRNMFADGLQRFATDLYDIGRYIRLHDAMLEAWEELCPGRIEVVDYEALTAEPAARIPGIVAAAGLPWEDACLAPHEAPHRVQTLSFAQVRRPIYRSSVEGWRRFEAELSPLEAGLAERVEVL